VKKTTRRSSSDGPASSSRGAPRKSKRTTIVIACLFGSLSLTSLLLLVLAPPPISPAVIVETTPGDPLGPKRLEPLYDSKIRIQAGRWQSVYIHHSRTRRGDADALARSGLGDHFVIGNGFDTASSDGQIEVSERWMKQQPALLHGRPYASNQVTICVVGDFDSSDPTATQVQRVTELVQSLQKRLGIPASAVFAYDYPGSPAGIGRHFPTRQLSASLVH
jgi:hypothetical protein